MKVRDANGIETTFAAQSADSSPLLDSLDRLKIVTRASNTPLANVLDFVYWDGMSGQERKVQIKDQQTAYVPGVNETYRWSRDALRRAGADPLADDA